MFSLSLLPRKKSILPAWKIFAVAHTSMLGTVIILYSMNCYPATLTGHRQVGLLTGLYSAPLREFMHEAASKRTLSQPGR